MTDDLERKWIRGWYDAEISANAKKLIRSRDAIGGDLCCFNNGEIDIHACGPYLETMIPNYTTRYEPLGVVFVQNADKLKVLLLKWAWGFTHTTQSELLGKR